MSLARAGGVAVESRGDEEIVLRVRSPGRVVAPTVVLYPTENEWECDCPSRVSPCEHVAAAAIALSAPPEETEAGAATPAPPGPPAGDETPADASPPPATGGASPADTNPSRSPLPPPPSPSWSHRRPSSRASAIASRARPTDCGSRACWSPPAAPRRRSTARSPRWSPIRRARRACRSRRATCRPTGCSTVGGGARGVLSPGKLDGLMRILAGTLQVSLDGRPIALSDEELLPQSTLTDAVGAGGAAEVRLTITADPRVRAVVSPGVALGEEEGRAALYRLGETELGGAWLNGLPMRRSFPATALGELVTVVLPDLARRTIVDVRSRRLPPVVRDLAPRVVLRLDQVAGGLSVLPALVYGSPPVARIDAGKMVHLGGPVPVRDAPSEQRALERLRSELGLLPGRRTNYTGADAPRFVDKLKRWRGDLAGDAAGIVKPSVTLQPQLSVSAGDGIDGTPGAVRFELVFSGAGATGGAGAAAGATKPGASVDAAAVVRAWQEGLGIVPLSDGGWAALPAGWLQKHGQRVADLLAAREADGRLARHALPALAVLCAELEHPPPPGLDRLAPLVAGFDRLPEAALPADLTATLRAYQRQGVSWLAFLRGAGARRDPRRRHGARQDAAGDVRLRAGHGRAHAGGLPDQRDLQLGRRAGAVSPRPARLRLSRRRARPRPGRRRDADQLRAAAPRRDGAVGDALARRGPRRGAGDQEPRQPDGARRVRAAGVVSPGADRHAGREPPRRALEPDALRQPRSARRPRRSSRSATRGRSPRGSRARRRRCASACGRSCCGA